MVLDDEHWDSLLVRVAGTNHTHNLLHDVHLPTHDIVFIINLYVHYDQGQVAWAFYSIDPMMIISKPCHVPDPYPLPLPPATFMPVCGFRMPLSETENSSASYSVWKPLIVIDSYHFYVVYNNYYCYCMFMRKI